MSFTADELRAAHLQIDLAERQVALIASEEVE